MLDWSGHPVRLVSERTPTPDQCDQGTLHLEWGRVPVGRGAESNWATTTIKMNCRRDAPMSKPTAPRSSDPPATRPVIRSMPSPRVLRRMMNVYPPFLGSGIHVTHVAQDWTRVEVTHRIRPWNRNPNQAAYGGTLYAMTDPFFGMMAGGQLGAGYRIWTSGASIEFVAPGRESVTATMSLSPEEAAAIRAATDHGNKSITSHSTEIISSANVLVARVTQQLFVRRAA